MSELSKRERFAGAAMANLARNCGKEYIQQHAEEVAEYAVVYADKLIAALEKPRAEVKPKKNGKANPS
jgi:hypothetical protein